MLGDAGPKQCDNATGMQEFIGSEREREDCSEPKSGKDNKEQGSGRQKKGLHLISFREFWLLREK